VLPQISGAGAVKSRSRVRRFGMIGFLDAVSALF
jgi:hypothetical protein